MHPEQHAHIWEGDYVSVAQGAYFARELAEAASTGSGQASARIGPVAFDPLLSVRLFVDIGGTGARADSFAIWPAQFIGREIRVRDYYEAVGQPLDAHLAWLRGKAYTPGRAEFWLPHDGATHDRVFSVSTSSSAAETRLLVWGAVAAFYVREAAIRQLHRSAPDISIIYGARVSRA